MTQPRPCAVFDLDGCLIDSVPHFATILNAMLGDRGHDETVTEAQARPHATAGGLPMVQALLGGRCGEAQEALAEFRARYARSPTPDCLYPGVRDALEALRSEGVSLAVWSNKPQHLCDKVVGDLGLAPLFAAVVGTRADVPHKPDPTGMDLAIAACGSDRAHACFVGDSEVDYESARGANVDFVLVTHGYGDYGRDYPGARVVKRFAEVPAAVREILGVHG